MRREAGTFACAEHAIAVAYLKLALPIEPKNPTQMVCEALRERFDATYDRKALSGLSPHEWHAQAVFIVKLMERTLGNSIGFHLLRAQYATGLGGGRERAEGVGVVESDRRGQGAPGDQYAGLPDAVRSA